VNVHLDCIVSSDLKRVREMPTLTFHGKMSADAHAASQFTFKDVSEMQLIPAVLRSLLELLQNVQNRFPKLP